MRDSHSSVTRAPLHSYLLITVITLACLLPFCGKAFNIDDPLFVWTAQQIVHHPLDPYGFHAVWYITDMPMSAITKNPPLSSYYGAVIGLAAAWSEKAWHIGFLLPAIAAVLGTYRLARRFTGSPLIAAAATLFAPGFLVSATGVMGDVTMLALWIWAVILWLEGTDSGNLLKLVASSALITACALTKYFGVALIVLLPAYSLVKQRRFGVWVFSLFIPVAGLTLYQFWTKALYGRGLFWDAAHYARSPEHVDQASRFIGGLVGLSFLGGCALPILLFTPFLWSRRQLIVISFAGALAGVAVGMRWLHPLIHSPEQQWLSIGIQFALYVAGGISAIALAVADYRKHRDAESALLGLWVFGTFLFAAFLNWTVNARSLLPLIPAAAILLARRLDELRASPFWSMRKFAIPLVVSAILSVLIAWGDTAFANSERNFAHFIQRRTQNQAGSIVFEGHWGFQYYMQLFGAHPVEYDKFSFRTGDLLVIPENTTSTFPFPPQFIANQRILQVDPHVHSATMALGAGFYSSVWGPLPFSFGLAPPESYLVINLKQPANTDK